MTVIVVLEPIVSQPGVNPSCYISFPETENPDEWVKNFNIDPANEERNMKARIGAVGETKITP